MAALAKISPPAPRRRFPRPKLGIDINFCRNPHCDFFAVPPKLFVNGGNYTRQVKSNQPHGKVVGSDEKTFKCGNCGSCSIVKNNIAVVEEYRRLRGRFRSEEPRDVCPNAACANHEKPLSLHSEDYRKSGRTAKGGQRWKCKACLTSFSVGSRIRRQHRSNANREVLWMITNGMPISKIAKFTELCPRDVYRKIDFIYDRVIDTTARREAMFETVDWRTVGRRFATDSQTLQLNWPNKKTRAQISVPHICTAHANTGDIMAAHLMIDSEVNLRSVEASMEAAGHFGVSRAFRSQGRVWSQTEFKNHLDKITRKAAIHPLEAPEVDLGLQLPHRGALISQDIAQIAHAFLLRRFLGRGDERFVFVLDADSGLALSFISAFAPWVKARRADVIVVQFDKNQSNDQRNVLVADGNVALERDGSIAGRLGGP